MCADQSKEGPVAVVRHQRTRAGCSAKLEQLDEGMGILPCLILRRLDNRFATERRRTRPALNPLDALASEMLEIRQTMVSFYLRPLFVKPTIPGWFIHPAEVMAELPLEEVPAMFFPSKNGSSFLIAIKEEDLALSSRISSSPTEEEIQGVIDFLYKRCVPSSKLITDDKERALLKKIVYRWAHFLRIFKGRFAYVPLD